MEEIREGSFDIELSMLESRFSASVYSSFMLFTSFIREAILIWYSFCRVSRTCPGAPVCLGPCSNRGGSRLPLGPRIGCILDESI